jgi:hypothetical protein
VASDITLAVGDGARRMTYAELAQARSISLPSARRLVRRHAWARQVGNDGVVRILVPLGQVHAVPGPKPAKATKTAEIAGPGPVDAVSQGTRPMPAADVPGPGPGSVPGTDPLAQAIEVLRQQLALANDRADRAELRVDRLQAVLAEERQRLLAILTGPRRSWWRPWFR